MATANCCLIFLKDRPRDGGAPRRSALLVISALCLAIILAAAWPLRAQAAEATITPQSLLNYGVSWMSGTVQSVAARDGKTLIRVAGREYVIVPTTIRGVHFERGGAWYEEVRPSVPVRRGDQVSLKVQGELVYEIYVKQ